MATTNLSFVHHAHYYVTPPLVVIDCEREMYPSDIVYLRTEPQKPVKQSRIGDAYKAAWKERDKIEIELNRTRIAVLDEFGQLIRLNIFKEH